MDILNNSANVPLWTFFTMVGAIISAFAAIATAVIAFWAAKSWIQQERHNQMVRLKRASFEYRVAVERAGKFGKDYLRLDDFIDSTMKPALAVAFHGLVLAGLEGEQNEVGKRYEELFMSHELYRQREISWRELLQAAVDFQISIKVTF
ncbi:hypothetical protein QFV42_RS18880 [Escherichia coli]|nr:hypothetical protein [Escherichia coli]EKP9142121.1 hypothetical protein [Escherichia coli]EKP9354549.1 hypothetical protein [Escherichia coli]EKP9378925.1 hypothetical protein [Escherichia coli]EKP9556453.1 hypothetical protein [Escherichia coli]